MTPITICDKVVVLIMTLTKFPLGPWGPSFPRTPWEERMNKNKSEWNSKHNWSKLFTEWIKTQNNSNTLALNNSQLIKVKASVLGKFIFICSWNLKYPCYCCLVPLCLMGESLDLPFVSSDGAVWGMINCLKQSTILLSLSSGRLARSETLTEKKQNTVDEY